MVLELEHVRTWQDLLSALRAAGFEQTAELIGAWQEEYLPGAEDEPLPRESTLPTAR